MFKRCEKQFDQFAFFSTQQDAHTAVYSYIFISS